jgi:hypothetical protein
MMTGSITFTMLQICLSCGLHILLQSAALNVMFLLATIKDSAKNIFLGLAMCLDIDL